jgi:Domain of unknown function (DUF4111)/Nucleotidyltransferase domain
VSAVRTILGPRLVGVYLDGSIALGEFEADRSDIDFVVVAADEVREATLAALQALHAGLAATEPRWGLELEGSYVQRAAIRAHDARPAAHPYIDRHTGRLELVHHESGYWVIHRHVLREHGVTLVGPEPRTLIDPVTPAQLRDAAASTFRGWWRPMLDDPARLQHGGYRAYAVLTMCRMLYTLSHGIIVSKRVAARWAQETLDSRWKGLIGDALAWSADRPPALTDTLALIRYTSEQVP